MVKKSRDLIRSALVVIVCLAILTTGATSVKADDVDRLLNGFDNETEPSKKPSGDEVEDILSGFDDPPDKPAPSRQIDRKEHAVSLDGFFKLGAALNFAHDAPQTGETDWRGLSKLRAETQIDALARLNRQWQLLASGRFFYDAVYALRDRDNFTDDVLDEYEYEAEAREIYLKGGVGPHLDIKVGRQIVVWGRSDNLRVTDVLNPLDLREPGLTDIEHLRLPVTMTRLDGYWGQWHISGMAIHEFRSDKQPVFGHDFFPGTSPLPPRENPDQSIDNTEWALALTGTFSGKDVSFYWADLFEDNAHLAMEPDGGLIQKHSRGMMWGMAANFAMGNWLWKTEAAYRTGFQFLNSGSERFSRIEFLGGVEYSGWDETTLSFEWAGRRILDFDQRLTAVPDVAQQEDISNALRLTRNHWNNTLELTLLGLVYGPLGQDGALFRLSMDYDWNDAVNLLLGVALYRSGDRPLFRHIEENDRVFLEVKYSF